MKTLLSHLRAGLSVVVLAGNLIVWLTPLMLLALLRWAARGRSSAIEERLIQACYRNAVAINSWWLRHVSGIRMVAHPPLPGPAGSAPPLDHFDLRGQHVVLLANHRTWFDIPLLQALTVPAGPILKFVVKRELAWVPIVGWVCLVLRFPLMRRGGTTEARTADLHAVSKAAQDRQSTQDALIIFAEGTRITDTKHAAAKSPYRHLLPPKAGGFRTVLRHSPAEAVICDMTVIYRATEVSFWRCLGGRVPQVDVYLRQRALADVTDVREFLRTTWGEKDVLITEHLDVPDPTQLATS
ncbi:MAG: hypothetical protein CMQ24_08720 [Gammaproteobacteria bacterium]|nr:hypothetical protein [Gammaproteobacteria bacterium]